MDPEDNPIASPFAVGLDAGSVSVNCVVLDAAGRIVHEEPYRRHFGRPAAAALAALEAVRDKFGPAAIASVTFTGSNGQALAARLGVPWEPETVAQILGAVHVAPGVRTIIAIGGQDAALFALDWEGERWRLEHFAMNGPCASGTGSFIDQQAERLTAAFAASSAQGDQGQLEALLAAFIREGLASEAPAPVACRCTVFTKSDMIHLQNKGEPLANIIAGLHEGNAANFLSTIVGTRRLESPVIFLGGVASNPLQVRAFRRRYPDLAVPPHHTSLGAVGAALASQRAGRTAALDISRLGERAGSRRRSGAAHRPAAGRAGAAGRRPTAQLPAADAAALADGAWLGIDIGSTTTKFALVDTGGRLLAKRYVPTRGRPIEVARDLVAGLCADLGGGVRLLGLATTGSGRQVVGDFLAADLVIDEITAHARGAIAADPEVDTIFEIGGQDAKYIRLEQRHAVDFDMNKVCAAGTGSFLHELAAKLGVDIVGEFETVALASPAPVQLAERCTVFMESDLVSALQRGAPRDDLIAGLALAVVRNYLNRVVGRRAIGRRVMFLGGPSLNRAVVAAFEQVLGRPVAVPPHREVMGAFGAALAVRDAAARGEIAPAAAHARHARRRRDLVHGAGLPRRRRVPQRVQAAGLRLRGPRERLGRRVRALRGRPARRGAAPGPLRRAGAALRRGPGGAGRDRRPAGAGPGARSRRHDRRPAGAPRHRLGRLLGAPARRPRLARRCSRRPPTSGSPARASSRCPPRPASRSRSSTGTCAGCSSAPRRSFSRT